MKGITIPMLNEGFVPCSCKAHLVLWMPLRASATSNPKASPRLLIHSSPAVLRVDRSARLTGSTIVPSSSLSCQSNQAHMPGRCVKRTALSRPIMVPLINSTELINPTFSAVHMCTAARVIVLARSIPLVAAYSAPSTGLNSLEKSRELGISSSPMLGINPNCRRSDILLRMVNILFWW